MDELRSRLILDPSVLFTDEVLGWIENPELKDYLVVSQALWRRLEDPESLVEELARFGVPLQDPGLIDAVREALEVNGIDSFSYDQARERGELPSGTEDVCGALLEAEEPLADVLADEWAFVTSQSLAALAERAGQALGAFCRAGGTAVGVVKGRMVGALEDVQDRIPPGLLERMKQVDRGFGRGPRFLLAGGRFAADILAPPLGLAMEVTDLLLKGNAVLAGDP